MCPCGAEIRLTEVTLWFKPVTFDDYAAILYHISALYWHFSVIFRTLIA